MLVDSDDEIEILNVVTSARKPIAASPAALQQIDSDDDQPLEALKLGLKQALHSSQQSPSIEAPQAEQQQPAVKKKAAKKLVSKKTIAAAAQVFIADDDVVEYQAAARAFANSSPGKENVEATNTGLSGPSPDSDNWYLEPLQKRGKRRAAKKGATPDRILDAAQSPLQQEEQHSGEQRQAQQQQRRDSLSSHPHLQQEWQQHKPWQEPAQRQQAAADHTVAAAAEPVLRKPKRQRRTPEPHTHDDFDYHPDSQPANDVDDPDFDFCEPSAAAGGASGKARGGSRASARPAASGGSGRVRMTAEERAAKKAEEKARKEAEKIAAKLAKQAEAQAVKAAKRFETFQARKANGSFQEYECVLVMDAATSGTALGLAIAAELDRRKTIAWQVVSQLPLSNKWSGCVCFSFKRRKLCETDEHSIKTAASTKLEQFVEDVAPPYVQLVFQEASHFVSELQRDRLGGVYAAVQAAHPDCTLGVVVLGLKPYVQRLDNQQMRKGGVSQLDWRRANNLLLQLHLTTPGLQLRLLSKQEEVAAHIINTARVIGQQPHSVESQLEACGGAGPGAASKAASAAMSEELGWATRDFAINTLGKMHGMGGNKAWAVAKAYPSFGALIAGFQKAAVTPSGPPPALLLADLMEPAAGKAKPRRVGPAMSKRLHLLLTCEDPDTIVEGDGDAAGE